MEFAISTRSCFSLSLCIPWHNCLWSFLWLCTINTGVFERFRMLDSLLLSWHSTESQVIDSILVGLLLDGTHTESSVIEFCPFICHLHGFLFPLTIIALEQVPSIFFLDSVRCAYLYSSWYDLVVPLLSTLCWPPVNPQQWFSKCVWRNPSLTHLVGVLMGQ